MSLIVHTLGLPKDKKGDKKEDEGFIGNQKGVYPFRKPQKAGLIVKETFTNASAKYATFADIFSLTLGSTNILLNWSMPTDLSDYLSYLEMLLSFLTRSWTDPFNCMLIIEAPTMFPAMLVLITRTITVAITALMAMMNFML